MKKSAAGGGAALQYLEDGKKLESNFFQKLHFTDEKYFAVQCNQCYQMDIYKLWKFEKKHNKLPMQA